MKISHLLFDLDNTLYPSSSQMDAGITRRMLECVAEYFNCDFETAVELRKKNIIHYSTTLEWLRSEGFNDIEASLISGGFSALMYLLPIFSGAYADKIGYRKSMILAFTLMPTREK